MDREGSSKGSLMEPDLPEYVQRNRTEWVTWTARVR